MATHITAVRARLDFPELVKIHATHFSCLLGSLYHFRRLTFELGDLDGT